MLKLLLPIFLCFTGHSLQHENYLDLTTMVVTLTTTLNVCTSPGCSTKPTTTTSSTTSTSCHSTTYTDIDPRCLNQQICCPPDGHPQWNQKSNTCVCVLNPTTYPTDISTTASTTMILPTSTSTTEHPTDCAVGIPSTIESYVIFGVQITPVPSPGVKDVVPLDQWERKLRITTTNIWSPTEPSPEAAKAFAEYKCQKACDRRPAANLTVPSCRSWFVGLSNGTNSWSCSTYAMLITQSILVPAPGPSNSSLTNGSAWNALCGADSPCTTGVSVTLNPQSTVTYAQVTPTEPLPVTGTLQGYTVETGFQAKYSIGEQDIVIPQNQPNDALMACQAHCTGTCASWFVAFFLKGAGGYFWRCIQFSELLTPAQMIPKNFSNLVNSTAWNEICGK